MKNASRKKIMQMKSETILHNRRDNPLIDAKYPLNIFF